MSNISDTDLQMFRERAKTELASGCDVSRLRWEDVVESLCKEVARLRKELAAGGNAAKLREALKAIISGYEKADLCDMNYGEWCHDPANVCENASLCKAIHEAKATLVATSETKGEKQ